MGNCGDARRSAKNKDFDLGDAVIVENTSRLKGDPKYGRKPYTPVGFAKPNIIFPLWIRDAPVRASQSGQRGSSEKASV